MRLVAALSLPLILSACCSYGNDAQTQRSGDTQTSQDLPESDIEVAETDAHPEARPFIKNDTAMQDVDAALTRAKADGKRVILVMGANWCHDSRGLSGWFATPRFSNMLAAKYEVVYIDAGYPQMGDGRNLDIAERFGVDGIEGTPTVLVLSADGKRLNSVEDARSWRNSASRSEDDIYEYFNDLE